MKYEIKELGIGGILDQSLGLIKNNFGMLMLISFIGLIISAIAIGLFVVGTGATAFFTGETDNINLHWSVGLGFLGVLFLLFLLYIIFYSAVVAFLSKKYLAETMTLKQALGEGLKRFFPMAWTTFLALLFMGLIGGIGAGVTTVIAATLPEPWNLSSFVVGLATFFVFLYLYFRWGLAGPIVVIERISGLKAMKRSGFLMKENKGKLIAITVLLFICVFLIRLTVIAFPNVILGFAIDILTQLISFFIGTTTLTVLYFSARCQKESFDLQMLADALETKASQNAPQAAETAE